MKTIVKLIFAWIAAVIVLPLLALYGLIHLVSRSNEHFEGFSQLLSLIPGKSGSYLRLAFYRWTMSECSIEGVISFLVVFSHADTTIEPGFYFGPGCNIGKSTIRRNCLLGSNVHVLSGKHQHRFDELLTPIREQCGVFEKIEIGEDCWIGNGALILASIGEKSVIGAGTVVTKQVPPYSIVAGNPGKIIGHRKQDS